MRRLLLSIAILAGLTQQESPAQPSTNSLTYEWAQGDSYPPGQAITWTGTTLGTLTPGSGNCTMTTGPETKTVWVRFVNGLFTMASTTPLPLGNTTMCAGMSMVVDGVTYPITVTIHTNPLPAQILTNNLGVADVSIPSCDSTPFEPAIRFANGHFDCQPSDRRPGGTFNMPSAGGTYTDIYG